MNGKHWVAIVPMKVKEDCIDAYLACAEKNAEASRKEPGVLRFEVVQSNDSGTDFVFLEVFRDPAAQRAHRETEHYKQFRATVDGLLQVPYTGHMHTFVSTEL